MPRPSLTYDTVSGTENERFRVGLHPKLIMVQASTFGHKYHFSVGLHPKNRVYFRMKSLPEKGIWIWFYTCHTGGNKLGNKSKTVVAVVT